MLHSMYTVLSLVVLGSCLYRDFKKDPGEHVRAKIVHSIMLFALVVQFANAFREAGAVVGRFNETVGRFSQDVGVVPGDVHIVIFFLQIIVSVIISVLAFKMGVRNDKARKQFLTIIPFGGLLYVFGFYRGWLSVPGDPFLNDLLVVVIGTLVISALVIPYLLVYRSPMMLSFFEQQQTTLPDDQPAVKKAVGAGN